MGLDTKTYWLTDRQSQCDFDFDEGSDRVTDFNWGQLRKIVATETREQSELGLGVQKSTGDRPMTI
jgi:hypothetical protein